MSGAGVDPDVVGAVERDGFAVVADAVSPELADELSSALASLAGKRREDGVYDRRGVYAARNLFDLVPAAKRLLEAPAVRNVVAGVLGPSAFCVRGLYLDRPPRPGWKVPWHQDATITVKERGEATGFGPWSVKGGVPHVMAPPGTLSAMLCLRVYLDECGDEEGMKAIPASHQYGRLPEDSLEQFTRYGQTACPVPRGGLIAMRPLLLQSSGAAAGEGRRRVIQLDFAARRLPLPLEWREAHPLASE